MLATSQQEQHWSLKRFVEEAGLTLYPKQGRPDQYQANCPFCGDKRKRLNLHLQRDVFNCYNCNESGGAVKFFALLRNVSVASAKDLLRSELGDDTFQRKAVQPRHPAERLSMQEVKTLGFVGQINWYELKKDDFRKAKQYADWMWRENQERNQNIQRLLAMALEE